MKTKIGAILSNSNKTTKYNKIKMASYLHRTAQPSTLATFRFWGNSTGAGRIRLAAANIEIVKEKIGVH